MTARAAATLRLSTGSRMGTRTASPAARDSSSDKPPASGPTTTAGDGHDALRGLRVGDELDDALARGENPRARAPQPFDKARAAFVFFDCGGVKRELKNDPGAQSLFTQPHPLDEDGLLLAPVARG